MCRQFDSSQHHGNPLRISGFFIFVHTFVHTFRYFYPILSQAIAVYYFSIESLIKQAKLYWASNATEQHDLHSPLCRQHRSEPDSPLWDRYRTHPGCGPVLGCEVRTDAYLDRADFCAKDIRTPLISLVEHAFWIKVHFPVIALFMSEDFQFSHHHYPFYGLIPVPQRGAPAPGPACFIL